MTQMQRQLRRATRTLIRGAEFLGMKFEDFIAFVEEAPLAQTRATMAAYRVYRELSCV
jgi:hypothetical protein